MGNFSALSLVFGVVFFLFVIATAVYYVKALYFQFFVTRHLGLKERMESLVRSRYFEKLAICGLLASVSVIGLSLSMGSGYLLGRGLIFTVFFLIWWVFMRYTFRDLSTDLKRTKQILGGDQ